MLLFEDFAISRSSITVAILYFCSKNIKAISIWRE
jgi:hypothetical protein